MTTTCDEGTTGRALTTLAKLGRDGVKRPTAAELDRGLGALQARIAAGRAHQRLLVRGALAAAAVLVSVLVILQAVSLSGRSWSQPQRPVLTYEVEGGRVLEGGYLRASGDGSVRLSFNEGSEFMLAPGTRGRLRSVDEAGARVAIESGTARFEVTPSDDRHWWVEVGPFLVTVKGTVFTVSWDPARERFELRLRQGRVDVSGPISDGKLALRSGQNLIVDLARGETRITEGQSDIPPAVEDGAPGSAARAPTQASAAKEDSADSAPSTSASSGAQAKSERRWADELASGNWDRILQDVDRAGVGATLNSASSEELFALADAARYRRRAELAREALLAHRRRFPGSTRALFLLGRVEESRAGGMGRALAWYDEYLARAPTGAYAAEALGRKMTITSKVAGPAEARPIAEAYLRRFPKGSYAGSARAILRVQ